MKLPLPVASAALAIVALTATACSGTATTQMTRDGVAAPNTIQQARPTGSAVLPTATAPLLSVAALPAQDAANVQQAAVDFFGDGSVDDIQLEGITPLGTSGCFVLRANLNLSRFPPNFVVLADGQVSGPEASEVSQVFDPCFFDFGLEPTAAEAALVAVAKAPFLIGLRLAPELPPEVVAGLPPDLVTDSPIDFANYAGPILVDQDGVPTSLFVAIDNIGAYHLVRTTVRPGDAKLESITLIYVG